MRVKKYQNGSGNKRRMVMGIKKLVHWVLGVRLIDTGNVVWKYSHYQAMRLWVRRMLWCFVEKIVKSKNHTIVHNDYVEYNKKISIVIEKNKNNIEW